MGEIGVSQPKRRRPTLNSLSSGSNSQDLEVEDIEYAGRILRIQMVNFMCHSNLEIKFNPRINFISGRNGSGKSAVMAALVVVFGGTAHQTGRGRGVSEFIKKGETSGNVTIEIMNEGINPYKSDLYGSRITITRSFTAAGSNSYTVKSAFGSIISKKKGEVDAICDVLHLDMSNPLCILNQDVARNFLTNSDGKLRFDLFMKSTQLELVMNLHTGTIEKIDEANSELNRKKQLMIGAKNELDELTKKLQYIRSLDTVIEERRNLENEFLWAEVVADERNVEGLENEKKILEKKLKKFNESIANHQARIDTLNEEAEELKQSLDQLMRQKQGVTEEKRGVQQEVLRVQNEVGRQETQLNLTLPKLQRILADIAHVNEYIQQLDERNNRTEAEYSAMVERKRAVEMELKENHERYIAAARDLENANETKLRARNDLMEASGTMKDLERNKAHKLTQLEGMRGQGDMDALRFGPYVPKLLEAIDNAMARRQFKRKPIGPLGMHVLLSCDVKWAPAIESVVGSLMASFCCDNSEDFKVLSGIMNAIVGKRQPSVIISKFQPNRHDVARNRTRAPGLSAILDNLTFNNDTAFNTFVDQAGIEGILLFEKDEYAAAMLTHRENVPDKLRMGVTLGCDRYYPAPNYRTYAGRSIVRFFNQSSRKEDVIMKLEAEIKAIDREITERRAEVNKQNQTLTKMDDFVRRTDARLRELRQRRGELEVDLSQLKDNEGSRPVPRTRLALEEELETLEHQKDECEKERALKEETIKKIQSSGQISKEKLEELTQRLEHLQKKVDRVETLLNRNLDAKTAQDFVKKNSDSQIQRLKQEINKNGERLAMARVELQRNIEDATRTCPVRVENTRPPTEITALLEQKERYLRAAERLSGTGEELIATYKEKNAAYAEKCRAQEEMVENVAFFVKSLCDRKRLSEQKQLLTAQEVAYYFRASLITRSYDGTLVFDFDDKKLDLEVHPFANEQGRTDSKTLSGGERSYSTVSFILAMWRAIVKPFYFLDEFDVFMDKVNRKVVMDLLLQYAAEKTKTQFVFITPQDISSITASDSVSIFKMPDPVRTSSRPSESS